MFWPGTQSVSFCEECKVTFNAPVSHQEVWGVIQTTTTVYYLILGNQVSWDDAMLIDYEHLCWAGSHSQEYPSSTLIEPQFQAKPEQQRGMIKESCKSWLNLLQQPQKHRFGLNHQAHEGWRRFSVVPTLQRPNMFCIGLTSHCLCFYPCYLVSPTNARLCAINFFCSIYSLSQAKT